MVRMPSRTENDMVCPLWNFAWGGQLGFRTWDSLQSARKEAVDVRMAQTVRRMRPVVRGGRGPGMAFYVLWGAGFLVFVFGSVVMGGRL